MNITSSDARCTDLKAGCFESFMPARVLMPRDFALRHLSATAFDSYSAVHIPSPPPTARPPPASPVGPSSAPHPSSESVCYRSLAKELLNENPTQEGDKQKIRIPPLAENQQGSKFAKGQCRRGGFLLPWLASHGPARKPEAAKGLASEASGPPRLISPVRSLQLERLTSILRKAANTSLRLWCSWNDEAHLETTPESRPQSKRG